MVGSQGNLFADAVDPATGCKFGSAAAEWAEESSKHALDDLFNATRVYKTSKEYHDLLKFIENFRFYSPFNAILMCLQRPGATFVAPANKWVEKYGYKIKPNANPLVILQPMGPVMFVFDAADTEPGPNAKPLPSRVRKPFAVTGGKIGGELERTIENAKRDGVLVLDHKSGSQLGGSIRAVYDNSRTQRFQVGGPKRGEPLFEEVPVRYEMLFSEDLSKEARYATIVHELAHLYCGHLGTPNKKWWPDRTGLSHQIVEFEAESVSHLVCARLDIKTPSEEYLSGYVSKNNEVPKISLECVMKAAGLIERMGKGRLKKRKKQPTSSGTVTPKTPQPLKSLKPKPAPETSLEEKIKETFSSVGEATNDDFDQAKWELIRPLLKEVWDDIVAAGKSMADFVEIAIEQISPRGRPYFEKFVREELGGKKDASIDHHIVLVQPSHGKSSAPKAQYGANNKIFTKEAADKTRACLRKKLGQPNVGIDPR